MRIIGYIICKKSKVDKDAPVLERNTLYSFEQAKRWCSYLNAHVKLTKFWYEPVTLEEPPNDSLRT